MFKRTFLLSIFTVITFSVAFSQTEPVDKIMNDPTDVAYYSSIWSGERMDDGRPKVSDDLLNRLKRLKLEDVWQYLNERGYTNQFESGWKMLHEDQPMVGRALTVQFMPTRPDIQEKLFAEGQQIGHVGPMNSWPIDQLDFGDIYVADGFGKIAQGTLIGEKLGNSIFARSQNGVVFDASVRDVESLEKIDGFNAFVRDYDPTFLKDVMLTGVNTPIRIGKVTVMPGDIVYGRKMGVVFIPPHMVEELVVTSEIVDLRDEFALERVRARVYTAGQVDTRWTKEIEDDFIQWLKDGKLDRLPVPIEKMQEYLRMRTW
jgi:regulator of RNase E activity RraA